MSDTCMDRHRHRRVLVQTLIYWTLIGLCCAGNRPFRGGQRPRHTRHHDRGSQRIQYPLPQDQGAQQIEYPSVNDRNTQVLHYPSLNDGGQTIQYPSLHDSSASSQIQKCAPGYYRDGSWPYLGRCLPCECNGLADECEDGTGRCLNCQYNTAGDRCEVCKEGYYGNAAQRTCRLCPCPVSSTAKNFAVGCREVYGEIQCSCRVGYTGEKCERCAPGYFGDPLAPGGSCRRCNCNGNGNNCDSRTGVCKNTLEPGDTNTDVNCKDCDSCAQTLLNDLEKLDNEFARIKAQLDNASASATSKDRLEKLEKSISDTKILVRKFNSVINTQKSLVEQLEEDMTSIEEDINKLNDKADRKAAEADKALAGVGKTYKRAKDLDTEIKNLLKKIQDLLDQLKNEGRGDSLPNESLAKMLQEAQRMVNEMEDKDFTPQRTAAEKEKEEAKKLLDYIKNTVSEQSDKNEEDAKKIRSLLKDYETKLKDLDDALKEAKTLVKKANSQNGLNAKKLDGLQKTIEDLKKERKTVEDQMAKAEEELQLTEDLVKNLTDSKTAYEQLAAALDGAKTDLIKKVNEIAKAAAQEPIVEVAEEHARNLSKQAQELKDALKNASGLSEVRDAKNAIEAYKNITDAINAAEAAANEAKSAADKALKDVKKQKFPERAKDLKESSEDLLKDANDAEKDLKDGTKKLTDLTERLSKAEEKKKALEKSLLEAQRILNNTKRDDIGDMIEEAKRKAASANNTATNTMDRLLAIRKEIEKINVSPVEFNTSSVLDDVDKSVKNLLKTIPSLSDKITEVENLTSQVSISNVSANIKKIKELIEEARDAANRIVIPMKFGGDGHVELRTPANLDDLKAYTAMSLALQRPGGRGDGFRRRRQTSTADDLFVLYLGSKDSSKNYIGMYLKNNVLHGVYKLNGKEYDIETGIISTSVSEPATFDRVDLRRIYQDAEMKLTKDITSNSDNEPIQRSSQGQETKDLLDLNPEDTVFYVGGYPTNFTPPPSLRYPNYKGCIEFFSFNDKAMSLYNFQRAEKINPQTPCKRYVSSEDSNLYEGTGYGKVNLNGLGNRPISVDISSRSETGLLMYMEVENDYLLITIEKGAFVIRGNVLTKTTEIPIDTKVTPTSGFSTMIVSVQENMMSVYFNRKKKAESSIQFPFDQMKALYIGGVPQELREKHNITIQPFKGCMQRLQIDSSNKALDEQVGVSKGCPRDALVTRKAQFSFGSSLSSELKGFDLDQNITVSLGFKSTEQGGLILQGNQLANTVHLALDSGHVVLNFKNKMWKSNKKYNDGHWHYLTFKKSGETIGMHIDDDDSGQELSASLLKPGTGSSIVLGDLKFKGCISNLYTRRPDNLFRAEDLSSFQAAGDVMVDVCSANSPVQQMLDRNSKKDGVMQVVINESVSACALPAQVQHAYRMGGAISSLTYNLPLEILKPRPHFSLDVRTRSPEGLLFFAPTRGGHSHLALYMSKGRIRLSVGKQKIFNREKYNDGKWHSVIFSLERKKFRLIVDGIRARDGQLTNPEMMSLQHFVSPVYLGSAPESLHKELKSKALPKQSVSGCVRNFKMNGALMSSPTTNRGAGPCFEGPTQRGVYFSGNGAHVMINESFVVGSTFELLFNIRPRTQTGLLLHVGASSRTHLGSSMNHFLTVYMRRGEVVAQVNNGKGEFMVSVKPKTSLCDGMFHKISVIKRKNVVQLSVDTMDNYKIGPPSSTSTLTKDPLYVGGIPDTLMQQILPVTSSFVGCIQEMKINDESISFDRSSSVFGPVNLKECPG